LAATVLKALAKRNDLNTAEVDDIIWGTSSQRGKQGADLGRMAALDAGYDIKASGMTLDRFCGSGITTVNMAAASIMSGMEDLVIAGGTEMMSYTASTADPKSPPMMDQGNLRLRARHPQSHQGVCADAIATLEGISARRRTNWRWSASSAPTPPSRAGISTRASCRLQGRRHACARSRGIPAAADDARRPFGAEAVVRGDGRSSIDDKGTTYGGLIRQVYPDLKITHIHHAGNSSGVVDGAGAVLLASPEYAKKHGMKPRARVVAMANMGDSPTLMLNAPVPAARKVLEKAGLTLDDIDLFEINEAFAVVAEKFIRDLKLDRDKVNVNGGAMALGHPIGATGSILIGTILDELERRDLKRGLVTMCAAGGMAPAIIIERI
jgi:acetyl-CoA C-acetyltransferase